MWGGEIYPTQMAGGQAISLRKQIKEPTAVVRVSLMGHLSEALHCPLSLHICSYYRSDFRLSCEFPCLFALGSDSPSPQSLLQASININIFASWLKLSAHRSGMNCSFRQLYGYRLESCTTAVFGQFQWKLAGIQVAAQFGTGTEKQKLMCECLHVSDRKRGESSTELLYATTTDIFFKGKERCWCVR